MYDDLSLHFGIIIIIIIIFIIFIIVIIIIIIIINSRYITETSHHIIHKSKTGRKRGDIRGRNRGRVGRKRYHLEFNIKLVNSGGRTGHARSVPALDC